MRVCLIIIDGWGHNERRIEYDAINDSHCSFMRYLSKRYPSFLVHASGVHVGLPEGSMGNSEVGHLTIGSGRIIQQNIVRINDCILKGKLKDMFYPMLRYKTRSLHVIGLLSDGGIHSHINHLFSSIEALSEEFTNIYIHCISDGRDTEPDIFLKYYNTLCEFCSKYKNVFVVSVAGRFYAMDRDGNMNRTEQYFNTLTKGEVIDDTLESCIKKFYYTKIFDENITPIRISEKGKIKKNDFLFFFNFRADRMRQIVKKFRENGNIIFTMVEYDKELDVQVVFKKLTVENTLPEVLDKNNISHSHIAETEKYAHVTYFFNGGKESKLILEKIIIVESPKVSCFSEIPEMSSVEVTEKVIQEIYNKTDFIVCNFAPPDMVGHTGDYEATKRAVEAIDKNLKKIVEVAIKENFVFIITADHGNAEYMFNSRNNKVNKKHTCNKVPLILGISTVDEKKGEWGYINSDHSLKDIAPTILKLFQIEKPEEMTGKNII